MTPTNGDFRRIRAYRVPGDLGDVRESIDAVTDLIDEEVWESVTQLPSNACLITSNHHGTALRKMALCCDLWKDSIMDVVDVTGQLSNKITSEDIHRLTRQTITLSMNEAADEFTAMMFLLLHGFYRQCFTCLRSALERMVIGTCYEVLNERLEHKKWLEGDEGHWFKKGCDKLSSSPKLSALQNHLCRELSDSIFAQKDSSVNYNGGWARRLWSRLSEYAHSRPRHTGQALSGGPSVPIYNKDSFELVENVFSETLCLCYILNKIGRPDFEFTGLKDNEELFGLFGFASYPIAQEAYVFLFGRRNHAD